MYTVRNMRSTAAIKRIEQDKPNVKQLVSIDHRGTITLILNTYRYGISRPNKRYPLNAFILG